MKTIKELLCLTEGECFAYVKQALEELKIPYSFTDLYIVTDIYSDKCPLVCVHLDTISKLPPPEKDIIERDGILRLKKNSKAKCLGADDRAGVWIALEMLRTGTKTEFEYGFFCGEEVGGKGSQEFSNDDLEDRYTCFIGLDRASKHQLQNIAEYGSDNDELLLYFTEIGFTPSLGTFTDCSNLSMACDLACVNVSVGYEFEHTSREVLYLNLMLDTLNVMQTIVIKPDTYIAKPQPARLWRTREWLNPKVTLDSQICCDFCGQHERLYYVDGSQLCEDCAEIQIEETDFVYNF